MLALVSCLIQDENFKRNSTELLQNFWSGSKSFVKQSKVDINNFMALHFYILCISNRTADFYLLESHRCHVKKIRKDAHKNDTDHHDLEPFGVRLLYLHRLLIHDL